MDKEVLNKYRDVFELGDLFYIGCIDMVDLLLKQKHEITHSFLINCLVQFKELDVVNKNIISLIDEVLSKHQNKS